MYPQEEIDGFERYWRRRKPGRSTAVHYRSDVNIFFSWAKQPPAAITVHHIDQFIDWQRELGRAPATIQRRLVAIRMFYDYLAYIREEDVPNPVLPRRHYITLGRHLPRDIPDEVITKLFEAIGSHLRDRTMFTLMLHAGLRGRGTVSPTSLRCPAHQTANAVLAAARQRRPGTGGLSVRSGGTVA